MTYARQTSVPIGQTRGEIERLLVRAGATQFAYATDHTSAAIMFTLADRAVRISLPLPDRSSEQFSFTPARGTRRNTDAAHRLWEQACKASWRALLLVIRAKLEAVEQGISTIEREFLADMILRDGRTVWDVARPQLAEGSDVRFLPGACPAIFPDAAR